MSTTPKSTKRVRGKVLLIVSLAFNLIVVGLIVGAVFGGHYRGRGDAQPPLGVRGYLSAMTKIQRRDFQRNSSHGALGHLKVLRKLNTHQLEILDTMQAEPFEKPALIKAMAGQRDNLSRVMANFHGELAEALAAMSHDERSAYVARYKKRAQKHRGKHHKRPRRP